MRTFTFKHLEKQISINIHTDKDSISRIIASTNNFFELAFLEFIRTNYPTQRGIIDIGANIGNHALFFSEFLEYEKIYCFEPDASNVELLKHNMSASNCEIYDMALSSKNGSATLYNSSDGGAGTYSLERFDAAIAAGSPHRLTDSFIVNQSIPVRTLDSYNLQNISMIKIDVENHEPQVLAGARQTILENRPLVFIENLYYLFPYFSEERFHDFFLGLDYVRKETNICGFYSDLWVPRELD